jgi:hypothetical protein
LLPFIEVMQLIWFILLELGVAQSNTLNCTMATFPPQVAVLKSFRVPTMGRPVVTGN